MINFWNSAAIVYLFILLIGTCWMVCDEDNWNKNKSSLRLTIEMWIVNTLLIMWIASMAVFPLLIAFGQAASNGDMWGLIPI